MKAEYIQHMGTDLTVVNAARVSFDKESKMELPPEYLNELKPEKGFPISPPYRLSERDTKLIKYLAKHNHWTPFAHCIVSMRITVPFFVANQLKRHQIGFALNEVSRRYVDDEPVFYVPNEWRGRPPGSIKQGSSDTVIDDIPWVKEDCTASLNCVYGDVMDTIRFAYDQMIKGGVAPEMARMILPQSTYTSWWWTGSLVAWARLCKQRLDSHAQSETREIAQQVSDIISPLFPVSWKALLEDLQ